MTRLNYHYKNIILPEMIERFTYVNTSNLPKLEKIVLNWSFRHNNFNTKYVSAYFTALEVLTGQRPNLVLSTKSNATLKIRKNFPLAYKVTLRGQKMFQFLDMLVTTLMPRIKYFQGLSLKSFSDLGNYTFTVHDPLNFLELEPEFVKFSVLGPLDITFVFKNSSPEETLSLLTAFQIPFED